MIIRSKNFNLKLEEILKDNLPTERYNEHENFVLEIIKRWHSTEQSFVHQTSGSTGRPKKINISRNKIEISAKATMSFIDPKGEMKTSLLCIDPRYIGGAMVIYRSLIYNHNLTIIEPTSTPFGWLNNESFDLVSLVPMQFLNSSDSDLNRFHTILIGGAPLDIQKTDTVARVYSTFGMTETISHIALRPINSEVFVTTGDTKVATKKDGSLKISGSITGHKWLETNDLVTVISENSFKWIGRKDFVINSGGVKINPETIESQIHDKVNGEIMVGSLPDEQLGRKVVLLSSGQKEEIDLSSLSKYHTPKAIYFGQKIFKTPNGKIDRMKTQNFFELSI